MIVEWITDNKLLTALATLFGISGLNVVVIVRWLRKRVQKIIDDSSKPSIASPRLEVVSTPEIDAALNSVRYRNGYGYTIFEAKEHDAERNDGATLLASIGSIIIMFSIAMLLGLLARADQNGLAAILMLPPMLGAYPLAMWIHRRQYFIVSNSTGSVFYFNRGIFITLKNIVIDMDAEQMAPSEWLPRLRIDRQIIAEGEKVDSKEKAFAYFQRDAEDLKRITNGKLRRTAWEWNETRIKLDALERKAKAVLDLVRGEKHIK